MVEKFDLTQTPSTHKMVEQLKALCDTAQRTGLTEYLPGSSFIEERKNMPRPNKNKIIAHQACEIWNSKYPVGTAVIVTKDDGSTLETVTTHEAYVMSDTVPVTHVEGIGGCYLLERIKAKS